MVIVWIFIAYVNIFSAVAITQFELKNIMFGDIQVIGLKKNIFYR